MTAARAASAVIIGLTAGLASGILGVGGGIVMIPLLVAVLHLTQHHAHATSLAAIVLIAAAGAVRFALDGSVDMGAAALLAGGSLIGSPVGASALDRIRERPLKIAFGALGLVVAAFMFFTPGSG